MGKTNTVGKVFIQAQSTLRLVDPAQLIVNPDNERDYADRNEGIDALYQSILAEGLKTPIQIYSDGTVHDGNRRLFVINKMREEGHTVNGVATRNGSVLALIVSRPENGVEATIARLNTNEARQFGPLAQTKSFAFLRGEGLSNSEISKRTPFTAMHIGNMLTLADAGEAIHHVIRGGQISATLAVETLRKHGENVVLKAVDLALRSGKDRATGRHVDEIVDTMLKVEKISVPSVVEDDVDVVPFEVDISENVPTSSSESLKGSDEVVSTNSTLPEGDDTLPEGDDTLPEGVEDDIAVAPVAKVSKKSDNKTDKAQEEGPSDTTYKFTLDAAKVLMLNFLPYAKRRLVDDISDSDFKVELGLLVNELKDYGISVD